MRAGRGVAKHWCGKADGSGHPYGRYGLYDTITRRQAAALIERTSFGGAPCSGPEL